MSLVLDGFRAIGLATFGGRYCFMGFRQSVYPLLKKGFG